jgi:putative transposase
MRKSKFSESQIVGILREAEGGVPAADLLRKHGISRPTFFEWRSKYGGATVSDVKRLRELEAENAKRERMYADLGERGSGERATCLSSWPGGRADQLPM